LLSRQGAPPHATYLFKHALVQDAAYGTLLREPRRALHARIAETLENEFPELADRQPELLARHCTEAGLIEKAAGLWAKAGLRSLQRSALAEASEQLTRALAQLATLPATAALRREQIRLQVALLTPLMHLKGHAAPETKAAVERARLRAVSLGYAALVAEVLVVSLAGASARNETFTLVTSLVTLAIVPLLYVSFLPPSWLRWLWRQPEEDEFRKSLHDLLLYSPDRATLAQRALVWATRLVGGAEALIVDADGSMLASRGMTADRAAELVSNPQPEARWRRASTLVIPLHLQQGDGRMVIVSGPFTPGFGDDEVVRLRQYASSVTAGLDRVSLTERIASLEKAKTDFLSVASHELRGPMTVIKGYLTMLESGALGELSPRSMRVLPLLIAKSDEVNWMVEQMVEASRLEEGRVVLKKQTADVMDLTERAIEGMRTVLAGHELKVEKPSRVINAEVDPDRFQIVIRNLLSNAAKYSPAGSTIKVLVSRNGGAGVSVTDEGIGIAPEDQARLFTRFVRIEKQSTQHISGTGLGLWLSREIARMHDGDLTVESTPGSGSTFTLQLPLTR